MRSAATFPFPRPFLWKELSREHHSSEHLRPSEPIKIHIRNRWDGSLNKMKGNKKQMNIQYLIFPHPFKHLWRWHISRRRDLHLLMCAMWWWWNLKQKNHTSDNKKASTYDACKQIDINLLAWHMAISDAPNYGLHSWNM